MSLLGNIIAKKVITASTNSTIKAVGDAAANVVSAAASNRTQKEDAVVKNGTMFIKPTRSSENYINKNAYEIAQELLGAGFERVTLTPLPQLSERSVKKYGSIKSITINGNDEFLGIKRIPASSYIVIKYLDFKKGVSPQAYSSVQYITPGVMQAFTKNNMVQERKVISDESFKRFCVYCGQQLQSKDVRFCAYCGKAVSLD